MMSRIRRMFLPVVLLGCLVMMPRPALAVSKEIVELQTQVQQLLDMMQRMQSTLDARFGVLQHLVEQSTDSVNRMSAQVTAIQQKMGTDNEAISGKIDAGAGQVQSVNDSLDELKARIGKLDKQLQDIQTQLQAMQQAQQPASAAAPGSALAPGTAGTASGPAGAPTAAQAPPLQDTYQSALRDYNAAHYDVAGSEFSDVLHYYPQDDLAGNAQFYMGEIAYRQQKFKDAVKAYTAVIDNFTGNPKVPAAELHKGLALIQLSQKDAGIRDLRTLIQKFPNSPESVQARRKLNEMGVRISPRP